MRPRLLFVAAGAVLALSIPGFAAAERAERSQGVGVCLSQLAIEPEIVEVANLGEGIRANAGPAMPGFLDEARNACGEPPGPGHL